MITKSTLRRAFWFVLIAFLAGCGTLSQERPNPYTEGGTVTQVASPFLITLLPPILMRTSTPLPIDFPTHIAETLTARPTLTPSPTSVLQPQSCTFPLAQTTKKVSIPKEYSFSEPKVVLTDELQPDIVDWLPDNQNVLIMPLKLIDLGINGYRQTIELFNPETKATQIFATRRKDAKTPPAWNPALSAIVYPDMNILEGSTIMDFRFTRQVRISYGNPNDTKVLADNLPQYSLAVKPDGTQMAYLLEKQLFRLDSTLKPLSPVSFDRKRWDYLHENTGNTTVDYEMAWRPNSSQIFLYNQAYDNLGYTYILDVDTGRLCNLNFDGWALATHWSPNGRYLAIIRAQDDIPVQSTDLAVLDTATGNLYTLGIPQEIEGRHLLKDIAWAPDNRHLIFIIETTFNEPTYTYGGLLYLVDFISSQADHVIPLYQFNVDGSRTNLAWSPDGSKILMNCPTSEGTKQVCLISVQTAGQ